MSKNIIEKIWDSHVVKQIEGHPPVLAIDLMLVHEVTSAQAFKAIEDKGITIHDTGRLLATIDHSIPTRTNRHEIFDDAARKQVETIRANVARHKVPIFDLDSGNQGVVHVVGPELGATQPGMTIICGDSHTATHGAFGALAFGVGTSEVSHMMASGCILQDKPRTMRVVFKGKFKKTVYAKDAILKLIAEIGVGGGTGYAIEYCGEAIERMSMEERMTVCNMSIECGARAGVISPDQKTFDYIKGKRYAPKPADWDRAVEYWLSFKSDADAQYDKVVEIDVSSLKPMVTWGTNPGQGVEIDQKLPKPESMPADLRRAAEQAYEYVKLSAGSNIAGTPVQWVFVGSCTNGRIEDLRVAAKVMKGRKVAPGVTAYIVPGSEIVQAQAIKEGLDKIFIEAGAQFRMPGCSMCLAMNDDRVPAGERCVSTSNRNFVGRQGTGSYTHLVSPATAAASAIKGYISSAEEFLKD